MHDVIIIGGSFAGLSAALQLGRARRSVLVLDTGLPRNRFAAHAHGFLGNDGTPPLDILAAARRQLEPYATVRLRNHLAVAASQGNDGFAVELDTGEQLAARRLILAHGMVDDLSALPRGAAECWGKTVLACPYCHGFEFADRRLGMLLRHGDALLLASLYREWSASLTLFTNGAAIDDLVRDTLIARGVVLNDDTVLALEHDGGNLRAVLTASGAVAIDALFAHPPARFSTNLGVALGCETRDSPLGPIFVTSDWKQTSIEGVLAAGDIARPVPNISDAVADGRAAGVMAHRSLLD